MDFGKGREQLSTAEEVEKLKEPGKFELLATAVLCKAERDYRAILHSGLNAQGQPIKSPVDGFCRVPNSTPPHFVLVEHTVEDNLEKKWLFDHRLVKPAAKGRKKQLSESDDGDLLKAGRLAQQIKAEFPEAKFTVVLTTSQGLKPDFWLKVEKKAEELGVSVVPLDRSRIARFLDTEPEGQWLRKEYLGLDAEMLSESLLRDLCYKSLSEYRKQFLTSPKQWVSRQIDQQVENEIDDQSHSIQLLIGNSGSGKSATAYQIGEKHLETDGYSLWLSENVLVSSDSLSIALDRALHDLYPSLMPDAGDAALRLLKNRERLLLIADDVNRTSSPANLLQKLVNWSKPVSSGESDTKSIPSRHLFVCPVWSDIARLVTPDIDKTPWIGSVYIGTMTPEEGLEAVQNAFTEIQLTTVEAGTIAEKLGNDPILIGLFADLVLVTEPDELNQVAENVTDNFINRAIEEVSRTGDLLVDEYRSALSSLTAHMLQQRKLNPSLIELKEWLSNSSDEMKALRQLVKHGKLCRIEEEKLVFRHDRLWEALLVESMGQLLNNTTEPLDIFWEPYYAEMIGQAIVRYPQSEAFLKELCDRLPLALVGAIRCFKCPTEFYHQTIIDKFKEWVNREVVSGSVPESVLDAICWKLATIDSPVVLEITEKLPPSKFSVLIARFRNGCAVGGVKYLTHFSKEHSALLFKDDLRDQAIEQAKRYHKSKTLAELKQLLLCRDVTDTERRGTLALAGFLGFSELQDEIQICWENSNDKAETLPEAFWAAIRCNDTQAWQFLDKLLQYWDSLPFDPEDYEKRQKPDATVGISSALKFSHYDDVISYLIERVSEYKSLHSYISYIFRSIDSPEAVEFIAHNAADPSMKDHPQGFARQTSLLADAWNPVFPDSKRLSQASLDRLKTLWQEPGNDSFLRRIAFHIWEMGIDQSEFETLQGITSDNPIYRQALWKRAELSDFSIVPTLLQLLPYEGDWLHIIHYVWCSEVMDVVKDHLATLERIIPKEFSDSYGYEQRRISRLLSMIPKRDAETLIDEYWEYLGYSSLLIQTAFYIGTPRCLELAAFSVNQAPRHVSIFKHFSGNFYLTDENREKYTSKNQLQNLMQNLLPYIDYFDNFELWQLAEACKKFGISEWSRQHLAPKLSDEFRKRCHPTDDDLLQDLERFVASERGIQELTLWLEAYDKKYELNSSVVSKFILLHPTINGLKLAARCIQSMGTRKDISILDLVRIENAVGEISRIKASVQFSVYRRTLN